jgi:acylphosphatase
MFARDIARRLNLSGYVSNLSDGSVYVVAVGDIMTLNDFVRYLQRGPLASRVEAVRCEWSEAAATDLSGFEVRP